MLRIWLSQYKWAIIIGLLILYSVGLWHICSGYQQNSYNKERLAAIQEQQRLEAANELLSRDLSASLLDAQRLAQASSTKTNKGIIDEMAKHPNPPIPDSVRQQLNNSRNAGRNPATAMP